MSPHAEDHVLNKVELVLPRNVVETCYLLPTGVGTEFLSTSNARATFTRTHVFKGFDESVRIQITVSALQPSSGHNPEHVMIKDIKKNTDESQEAPLTNHECSLGPQYDEPTEVDHSVANPSHASDITAVYTSSANASIYQEILPDLAPQVPNRLIDSNGQIYDSQVLDGISAVNSITSAVTNVLSPDVVETQNDGSVSQNVGAGTEPAGEIFTDNQVVCESVVSTNNDRAVQACQLVSEDVEENTAEIVPDEFIDETSEDTPQESDMPTRVNFETCLICSYEVMDLEALQEHLLGSHSDDAMAEKYIAMVTKKLRVKCEVCHEQFQSQRLLNRHMNDLHIEKDKLVCDKCGAAMDNKRKLERHHKQYHQKSERFLCHLCPSSFKVHSYLLAHLRHVHPSEKQEFSCEKCGKKYATEKYLYNHKLRVHGQKKYTCPHCEKGFTNATNRDRHVMLVHERGKIKGHTCPLCERFFALKSNMMDHIKTVHRQEFSHHCDLCGAGFRRESELMIHKKAIHGNSRVKFPSPVKRKPGRPLRSGVGSQRAITISPESRTMSNHSVTIVPEIVEQQSHHKKEQDLVRTPTKQATIGGKRIEAVIIKASPEIIRTLGVCSVRSGSLPPSKSPS